jgi:hypothetical protein
MTKGGILSTGVGSYCRRREREGAVLHVSDSRPMARRNGWTVAHTGAPVFGLWHVGLSWQFETGVTEMA